MANYGIKIDLLKLKGVHAKSERQRGDKTLSYYPR